MAAPALVAVDWGSSSFRAWRLDAAGAVLDRRAGPHGILTVAEAAFGTVLQGQVRDWLDGAPVLMSGMIGSRQGWLEAPYVTCPAQVADLAAGLTRVPFDPAAVFIVPGAETATATMRDVMRGEETQIVGALARLGIERGRFLLPGTHSKWVSVEGGRITGFATYMTGEIFAACRNHTILGRLMGEGAASGAAFLRGVKEGARSGGPGALLHRLFGVRTAGLFGEIAGADLPDYLSGLLIGAEISDAAPGSSAPIHIIAADALAERYRRAASGLGILTEAVPSECVLDGHLAIARLARLLPEQEIPA